MVVVVPPLPQGQQPHHRVVHRHVARPERLSAPDVAHRVHRPRHVPHQHRPHAEAPQQPRHPTQQEQHRRLRHDLPRVRLLQPHVEGLLPQVRGVGVALEHLQLARVPDPAHVRPEGAVPRTVGVHLGVAVGVVVPVGAHPLDGVALRGERAEVGEGVLEPLGGGEGLVRELAVEAERDAEPSEDVACEEDSDGAPAEEEGGEEAGGMHSEDVAHDGLVLGLEGVEGILVREGLEVPRLGVAEGLEGGQMDRVTGGPLVPLARLISVLTLNRSFT
mmetsp:Transcript_6236/g.10596  ORF Transcript_6236/g.10596 Transcript_6236/m.10596 type:complete len:275 (-) Transcript_6236:1462-2286(-)